MKPIDIIFFPIFLLLIPVLGIISCLILVLDGGPIFFKQERIGKNGVLFTIYKFRTLKERSVIKDSLKLLEGDNWEEKFGRYLRLTSLDELPQVFNIIKGDMSLVGPRPITPYSPKAFKDYSNRELKKFSTKPGLTGLAQINGRNSISMRRRFVYDAIYGKLHSRFGVLLDFYIIMKTPLTLIKVGNVYEK